jgi:hypothetical protein
LLTTIAIFIFADAWAGSGLFFLYPYLPDWDLNFDMGIRDLLPPFFGFPVGTITGAGRMP